MQHRVRRPRRKFHLCRQNNRRRRHIDAQRTCKPLQFDDAVHLRITAGGDRRRFRVGLVPWRNPKWKPWVLNRAVVSNPKVHRIVELQRLASALGIDMPPPPIILPAKVKLAPRPPHAVLHANPMYQNKRWTDEGWRALAQALRTRGLDVVATGGPAPAEERDYLDRVWNPLPTRRSNARTASWPGASWPQLLSNASVYVGPDTSMTHLASGAGCPTVAIYGPVCRHGIGPWPIGGLSQAWAPPARSKIAAMRGWCRIRCLACRAIFWAANTIWKVAARVWTNCRCDRCCTRSTRRRRCRYRRRARRRGNPP